MSKFWLTIWLDLGSDKQTTLESVPHHLVIDRSYIHGFHNQDFNEASRSTVLTPASRTHTFQMFMGKDMTRKPFAAGMVPALSRSSTIIWKGQAKI